MKLKFSLAVALCIAATSAFAGSDDHGGNGGRCSIPQKDVQNIQNQLASVVKSADGNGSIFGNILAGPNRMWSAIVDRSGVLCSVIVTGDAWPGSRSIAIAKASAANDFSNDALALSTANLYAATQPGGSLYGLNNSNPFNPQYQAQGTGINQVPGGIITFGGGVPLYKNGKVIGGLGVSGDSACADHTIAYRMRAQSGFNVIPAGVGFNGTDNIDYPASGSPSGFQHPHCFPGTDIDPSHI